MYNNFNLLNNSILKRVCNLNELLWINNKNESFNNVVNDFDIGMREILDAEERLEKFAPFIKELFNETKKRNGIIESDIKDINKFKPVLEEVFFTEIKGNLLIKLDSDLPIAGSVKARGGIYEVLKYTEKLALDNKLLNANDDYSVLLKNKYRQFFNKYTIEVGSTGNLGLSIGIMSAKIGFNVIVHMSKDAKEWKKKLLRSYGVNVIEYETDYSEAVKEGRLASMKNPLSYFIDDEDSINLFLGYSVAALRLKKQLNDIKITVDSEHPLFVYIPCGIGGAPGGITFGLKHIYADNVHCFFVEPTHAPCMLVGMATGLDDGISVQDLGIDGKTDADGLAVGRPSKLVGKYMKKILSGIFTINDEKLYKILKLLYNYENIKLEPSACAAFEGVLHQQCDSMKKYILDYGLFDKMDNSTHIVWATGGRLVPDDLFIEYLSKDI